LAVTGVMPVWRVKKMTEMIEREWRNWMSIVEVLAYSRCVLLVMMVR
jgi:hypothetical protein